MSSSGSLNEYSDIPSPCFVLEEDKLLSNLKLLQEIQSRAGIKILCAFKGFAMWSTFDLLKQYLSGATASSLHEAMLCHEQFGQKAHLCAPAYAVDEIEEMLNISSHITFNSLSQFDRFGEKALKKDLKVGLRINPEYSEIETDLYNPCVPGSRLGIVREHLPDVLPQGVSGLHFHSMCEQNSDTLSRTLDEIEQKFDNHLRQVNWVNIGGGHHFTREDYDVDLFVDRILKFKKKYDLDIIAEPGEAIGWKTGFLTSTVLDVVESNGFRTAMLDVSFAAHMPDCLEMPYKPEVRGAVDDETTAYSYRLGGNTCLAGDFMGNYSFRKPLRVGDKIIFEDMIHYTMVKTNTFNGVKLPSIGNFRSDGKFELIKDFGYEDYKGRLS